MTYQSNYDPKIGNTIRFCNDTSKNTVHFTDNDSARVLPKSRELQLFLRENPQIEYIEVHPFLFDDYFMGLANTYRKFNPDTRTTTGFRFSVCDALDSSAEYVFVQE